MKSTKVLLLFYLSSSLLACSQATQDGSDGNLEEVLADMSPSSVVGVVRSCSFSRVMFIL